MPSDKNLQLLLAVLLPLAALTDPLSGSGAPADLPETSGEEQQDTALPIKTTNWYRIAKNLQGDVTRLRDEQFQRDFGEPTANMTNYDSVRIPLPLISPSDGCLLKNFSAQRCLERIHVVLRTYREYLSYVERENLTESQITSIKAKTNILLHLIKNQLEDRQTQSPISSELPDGSAWTQRIVTHSVLYNFAALLTDTSRAVHYMIRANHLKKQTKEWTSAKHPFE